MPLDLIEKQTGDQPTASIVVLHGLGADGNDFVPIAQELSLGAIGHVRFVFPHAPRRAVTINGGMVMRAWYDVLGVDFTRRNEDEPGLRQSMADVNAVLDGEVARGIAPERIVLAGFSQGCAMALLAGLRYPKRLAGIVGLSGYLPLAATTAAERHAANAATPVFIGHGRQDPVVPFAGGQQAADALKALGHPVAFHAYAMPHSVCAEEIRDLNQWLLSVLSSPAASGTQPSGTQQE